MGKYELYDDTIFGSNGHSGSVMAFARINLFRGARKRPAARRLAMRPQPSRPTSGASKRAFGSRSSRRGMTSIPPARLSTATDSLTSAREALRVREHRFKQGLDKMIDLLDAETALREAELRELVARYDVALGTYRLLFASGGSPIQLTEESS